MSYKNESNMANSDAIMLGCPTADEDIVVKMMELRTLLYLFRKQSKKVKKRKDEPGRFESGWYGVMKMKHLVESLQQLEALLQHTARKILAALKSDSVSILRALRITNKFGGLFRDSTGLIYDTSKFILQSPGSESRCKDILSLLAKELVKVTIAAFDLTPTYPLDWDLRLRQTYCNETYSPDDPDSLDETVVGGITLTAMARRSVDVDNEFLAGIPDPSSSTSEHETV